MEFGLFTEFHSPPGVSEAAAFDESLGQMKAAEDMGYDAVWLAEIHFQKDRSVLASPLVIASALAACTRRVKIGIAVQVLPLSHPLRLAEDVATVDHISKGRLEFGVGRSGLPGHYQGFNIPYSESRDRFLETLDILTKAWTQDRFSHQGKYFQFQDVCIMPKPYQKPHPPIRIAATTPETYPLVGRLGAPVFVAVRTVSLSDLKRHLPTYHTAWRESGHAGRGDVGVSMPLYVAETASQAREEPEASTMGFFRSISKALKKTDGATAQTAEAREARGQPPRGDHLRRGTRRLCGVRHAGSRRRPAARAARADGLHDAVVVDEPGRDDSERACAHVDASLRRASRAAPGMSAGQSGATSTS
jgi:alkanesulfonate monooxygenase SsuD/methylene tetrahydromethanopterin reductase-like flavin-dependent oxidoreductase (luciferase family)